MQKEAVRVTTVFGLLILLGSILFVMHVAHFGTLTGFFVFDTTAQRVDNDIVTMLEADETVTVIVTLDDPEETVSDFDEGLIEHTFSSGGFVATVNEEDLSVLIGDANVRYVEPVRYFETFADDVREIVGAEQTWELQIDSTNLTGKDQSVCVIDTGIDFTHPSLSGKNKTACTLNCIDQACVEDCAETDLNSHGTHVAGIVGANGSIIGVAPDVDLISLKVFPGSSGSGATTTGIKNAIDWCVSNKDAYNISVITMSLGTQEVYDSYCDSLFPSFQTSIDAAVAVDIAVVVASGNEGGGTQNTTAISSPACLQNAIPVSATDKDNTISDYGHYSSLVQLFAPGTSVTSTCLSGSSCSKTGTSMAAPVVTGSIAVLQQFLELTGDSLEPLEIEDTLNASGRAVSDGSNTFSRISINETVLTIETIPPEITLDSPSDSVLLEAGDVLFSCNASDWQLTTVEHYLWDSQGNELNMTNVSVSEVFSTFVVNATNLSFGDYTWNCLARDAAGFVASAEQNFTFRIGGLSTQIDSPSELYSNESNQSFSCSSLSEDMASITNMTFYLWDSNNSIVYNETNTSVSGMNASVSFTYAFSDEDSYGWNCNTHNNNSDSSWATTNASVGYDLSEPIVTLTGPADDSDYEDDDTITFSYSISDISPLSCELFIDNSATQNANVTTDTGQFSDSFTPGDYTWHVLCVDEIGYESNVTEQRTFSVTAAASESGGSGGGGGGGGSSSSQTQSTTENETLTPEEEDATFVTTEETDDNSDGSALAEPEELTTEETREPQQVSLVGNVIAAFGEGNAGFLSIIGLYAVLIGVLIVLIIHIARKRHALRATIRDDLR